jgi:hypothetical protein
VEGWVMDELLQKALRAVEAGNLKWENSPPCKGPTQLETIALHVTRLLRAELGCAEGRVMPTPNKDAAIRCGCSHEWGIRCDYPRCECMNLPRAVDATLRTAIHKEPDPHDLFLMERRTGLTRDQALAAYKAQPIYRELWGEE